MIKIHQLAISLILIAFPVLAASTTVARADVNLLLNPGFEQGISGEWLTLDSQLTRISRGDCPTECPNCVREGDHAAFFTIHQQQAFFYQMVNVEPNARYSFSGYAIKNDSCLEEVFLAVTWYASRYDMGNVLLRTESSAITEDQTNYQYTATAEIIAPDGAHLARLECTLELLDTCSGPASAYFDSLCFSGPPPMTPMPTPSSSPTPSPATPSTPTPVVTVTPTPAGSSTPFTTPKPTVTPSVSPTPHPSPSPTPTNAVTPAPISTPTPSPTGTTASPADILINEFQYDPPQGGMEEHDFEWMEVYNPGDFTIELMEWTISDNHESDLIPSMSLPPGSFAVIAGTEGFLSNFSTFDGIAVYLEDGRIGNGLNNDGDCLVLRDSLGNIIDSLSYGDDSSQETRLPDVAQGHSLERCPAGGEFMDNTDPTPGQSCTPSILPTPVASPTPSLMGTPPATVSYEPTPSPTPTTTVTPVLPATSDGQIEPMGPVLRVIVITAAISCLGIGLWLRRRRNKSLPYERRSDII